jgi:hypothetical protein
VKAQSLAIERLSDFTRKVSTDQLLSPARRHKYTPPPLPLYLLPSSFFLIKQPTYFEHHIRLSSLSFTLYHVILSFFLFSPYHTQTEPRCLTTRATTAATASRTTQSTHSWKKPSRLSTARPALNVPARLPCPQRQSPLRRARFRSEPHRTDHPTTGRSLELALLPPLGQSTPVSGGLQPVSELCLNRDSPVCAPSSLAQQTEFELTYSEVRPPLHPRHRLDSSTSITTAVPSVLAPSVRSRGK